VEQCALAPLTPSNCATFQPQPAHRIEGTCTKCTKIDVYFCELNDDDDDGDDDDDDI